MKGKIRRNIGLLFVFTFIVFFVFLITAAIIGVVSFYITANNPDLRVGPFTIILVVLVSSLVVGLVVSLLFGRIPLKPIRKTIDAINRLAEGDLSVRLDIKHPRAFQELAESFNRMAEELSSIEMLRSDFINSFSHELKTPIVSIKGFAEELQHDGLTEQEQKEYLSIIVYESNRLSHLATKILLLTKLENQAILLDVTTFNLTEQIRRNIVVLASAWNSKDIDLQLDLDEAAYAGSENLLSQVWMNLIDNAIKFAPENGHVSVSLRQTEGSITISISNDGQGMSEKEIAHAFEKFYQGDDSRWTHGNGLGLSLVKRIIDMHHGTIHISSKPEEMTTFTVMLP